MDKPDETKKETSEASDSDEEETEEEDPKSLKDILELVKAAGEWDCAEGEGWVEMGRIINC